MTNPAATSAAARRMMVLSQLRPQGVTDAAVLGAMSSVAREAFLPAKFAALAYADRPIRLDDGAPVMAPAELGQLLSQLAPRAGERALVIGAGGGYSAAVLSEMGLSVERSNGDEILAPRPFDLVLIEGAFDPSGDALFATILAKLLTAGGRVGAAIVEDGVTRLAIGRAAATKVAFATFAEAQVPLLAGFRQAPAFAF